MLVVYLRSLADLWAVSSWHEARFDGPYALWQSTGRVPTLLQQVLAQRMSTAVENIFRLLKLIHPPRDVEATYRSLGSGHQGLRATALEYLDNSLTGGVRRDVFRGHRRRPVEDKLRRAAQLFAITTELPEQTLGRLLDPDAKGDPAACSLSPPFTPSTPSGSPSTTTRSASSACALQARSSARPRNGWRPGSGCSGSPTLALPPAEGAALEGRPT